MDANKVLNRIKLLLGLKTDVELAEYLGVKRTVIAQWRRRGSIGDWELIFDKFNNLDLNWIVYGEDKEAEKLLKKGYYPLRRNVSYWANRVFDVDKPSSKQSIERLIVELDKIARNLTFPDLYRLYKIAKVFRELEEEF